MWFHQTLQTQISALLLLPFFWETYLFCSSLDLRLEISSRLAAPETDALSHPRHVAREGSCPLQLGSTWGFAVISTAPLQLRAHVAESSHGTGFHTLSSPQRMWWMLPTGACPIGNIFWKSLLRRACSIIVTCGAPDLPARAIKWKVISTPAPLVWTQDC